MILNTQPTRARIGCADVSSLEMDSRVQTSGMGWELTGVPLAEQFSNTATQMSFVPPRADRLGKIVRAGVRSVCVWFLLLVRHCPAS